jgi:hypothetical protein
MWRRSYLLLVVIRLWFALSPSYLHPDENFQGPEVIAGESPPLCVAPPSRLFCACHARHSASHRAESLWQPIFTLPPIADRPYWLQAKSLATPCDEHGNLQPTIPFEASFRYGPSMDYRCFCCAGFGSATARMARFHPSSSSGP